MSIFFKHRRAAKRGLNAPSIRFYSASALASVLVLSCAGYVWAFDSVLSQEISRHVQTGQPTINNQIISVSSPTSQKDTCLPLLNSIRHSMADTSLDRNQRSAGQAAALGLVIGMRFALQPAKVLTPPYQNLKSMSDGDNANRDRTPLAITAYRHCQKRNALHSSLQASNDISWTP